MYEYINGKIIEKSATQVVLDVSGIGYDIKIPVSTFSQLPALESPAKLYIHFVVREDAQLLYGFFSKEERDIFRLLISVSGIGPKVGVTVLSGMSVTEFKQAIIQGALASLTSISGIGKKTAERMIIELREKVVLDGKESDVSVSVGSAGSQQNVEDSLQALIALGYTQQKAKSALQKVLDKEPEYGESVEALIKQTLKYI